MSVTNEKITLEKQREILKRSINHKVALSELRSESNLTYDSLRYENDSDILPYCKR